MENIKINTENIKLDQFLKWANIVSTGGEAKIIIQEGEVEVNGEIERKRGRRLKESDVVECFNRKYKITTS
ncbi:RNA-binding S4 domain-containing protein [Halonatronum saccharophilum]|uniref:RNA-binding S4 domain-containing protein n=1 Tax=Halonatronum saccharophilum TaxID=150060 RepID=UPI00048591A4|nr:RNA-binding S4 domain-containing protein [Halonatronum saccharophilum]